MGLTRVDYKVFRNLHAYSSEIVYGLSKRRYLE